MADDTSLLLRIRGDNAQAKATLNETRAALSSLRQTSATEFNQMQQASTVALGKISSSLSTVTSRVPVFGNSLSTLTTQLTSTTSAAEGTTAGISAISITAGLAIAGIAALTVGVIKLGEELFEATKKAAEFEGKFEDLSQQVGVSVETLSTLDVAAATTGGNIETVTASLGIFQKNLEAAHDPTSKQAKLLKDLGVTSLDTEVALRQTLRGLFNLGEGSKQTAAVLELFGRSGRFVNAILKESNGNLDEATEKFNKLGLGISTGAALAADQFNDSMEIVSRQLDAIQRQIVGESIPVFIALFEEISQGLSGSKDGWKSWSSVVETSVAAAIAFVKTLAGIIATKGALDPLQLFDANFFGLLDRAAKIRSDIFVKGQIESIQRLQALITAGKPGDTPDPNSKANEEQARAAKAIALAQRALEESTKVNRERLQRERDLDLKNIDEWKSQAITEAQDHLSEQQKIFDREEADIKKFVKNRADALLAETELQQKRTKAVNDTATTILKIEDEANKRREQSELNLNRQLLEIRDAERAGELERTKTALESHAILESEAISTQLNLNREAFEDRKVLRDLELNQQTTSAERKIALDNERIESEIRFTNETKRLTQERIDALAREAAAKEPKFEDVSDEERARRAGAAANTQLGPPPDAEKHFRGLQSALDDLGNSFGKLLGASKDFGRDFGDVVGGAINDLAFGVGNLVEQYVLLGTTGPAALRKLLAATLAHLAAEAAVKAVFQLAEGFAALFINPAEAAAHFTSAAIFGSIAGVAAVAGRAVAGNLFQQKSGNSQSSSSNSGQVNPITLGRNQPQPQRIILKDLRVFILESVILE